MGDLGQVLLGGLVLVVFALPGGFVFIVGMLLGLNRLARRADRCADPLECAFRARSAPARYDDPGARRKRQEQR